MQRLAVCFILLAACGGNSGHPGVDASGDDAPVTDADVEVDADPDAVLDAAPGTSVRVEAFSVEGPLAGVKVAFFDASDAAVSVATTAADGTATGPAGGTVIAASPAGDRAFLWRAVEDGDVLKARFDITTTTHDVTFTLPVAASASYRIATRCGRSALGASRTIVLALPTGCTTSDIVAQRYSAGWNNAIHVPAQSLTGSTVDLTALTWAATGSYQIIANGVTANSVQLLSAVRIGDVYMPGEFYSTSGQSPVGTAQTTGPSVNATGAEVIARVEILDGAVAQIFRGAPPIPAFDGASRILSVFTPSYSTATHTVAWSFGGTGDPPDTVRATLVFPGLTWELVSPHVTATSIRIPTLPPELSSVDPGTTAPTTRRMRAYLTPGGYDRARTVMFQTVEPDELLAQPGLMRTADSAPP